MSEHRSLILPIFSPNPLSFPLIFLSLNKKQAVMIQLYGIPTCGSVKKAMNFFKAKGIPYEFINFKKTPVSRELLKNWLNQKDLSEIINKKGMTYRKLSEEEKADAQDWDLAQDLILKYNNLIKRPVIVKDKKIQIIGFNEEQYHTIF